MASPDLSPAGCWFGILLVALSALVAGVLAILGYVYLWRAVSLF